MNCCRFSKLKSLSPIVVCCVAVGLMISVARLALADVTIRPSGEHGVRITLAEAEGELKLNPALVDQSLPEPALRIKPGESKAKEKVGNLFMTVSANPLTVRVEDAKGRKVQELEFAETGGQISFLIGDGPVLGLGGRRSAVRSPRDDLPGSQWAGQQFTQSQRADPKDWPRWAAAFMCRF